VARKDFIAAMAQWLHAARRTRSVSYIYSLPIKSWFNWLGLFAELDSASISIPADQPDGLFEAFGGAVDNLCSSFRAILRRVKMMD
jgi:hypothetical protein